MSNQRVLVLDTSAFISGLEPSTLNDEIYSVPQVGNELLYGTLPRLRFDSAAKNLRLKVEEPTPHYLKYARKISTESGDVLFLSEADINIIGLAIQLRKEGKIPSIVSDDYSIQNVAKKVRIEYISLGTFGIRFFWRWLLYCPGCKRIYQSDHKCKTCKICGTTLKRKPQPRTSCEQSKALKS